MCVCECEGKQAWKDVRTCFIVREAIRVHLYSVNEHVYVSVRKRECMPMCVESEACVVYV